MAAPTDDGGGEAAPDFTAFQQNIMQVAERSQRLVADFLERQQGGAGGPVDPLNIANAFMELTTKMMADPGRIVEAQMALWQNYMGLWQQAASRMMGEDTAPVAEPERGDRRFRHAEWEENQVFDFIKQSYLLTARWMRDTVSDVEGLDDRTAEKVDFYTRQFIDAMAPTNFLMTNPEVLKATVEEKGENLVRGLDNMLADLERGKGQLRVRMVDDDAFEVGGNIAVTPGQVIWQTELMQLIQYAPTTENVETRPLLIVPPWINKFYILDLKPENSFIAWAVEQGLTVFVVSWVNPDESLGHKSFEDYMNEGILAALEGIKAATGEREVDAIGYCLGGTLLATTLGYMKGIGDERIASATFFVSLVDFEEPGELGVFIDEEQVQYLEQRMAEQGGVLDGSAMATTFNMLRANDLIWSFVVNNYLLGKAPFPFDLLYWNSDSTRMPAAMHSFYLRKMYQENLLREPGGINFQNVPLDLTQVDQPVYILSTKEDHIAPWKATYQATQIYSGPVRFVLAGSGHIAGVVNPPGAGKYGYWIGEDLPAAAEAWLAGAAKHEGSWWPDWIEWIRGRSAGQVPARTPGSARAPVLEAAPGSYVLVRGDG